MIDYVDKVSPIGNATADDCGLLINMDDFGINLAVRPMEPEPKHPIFDVQIEAHGSIVVH